MNVRILETRQNHSARLGNHATFRSHPLLCLLLAANHDDFAVPDRNSLRPWLLFVQCVYRGIEYHQIRMLVLRLGVFMRFVGDISAGITG